MATPNSLRSANDEIYENRGTINSLDELKKWLDTKNVKQAIIEKIAVSFMAKIPTGTLVEIVESSEKAGQMLLKVGESIISLGENITKASEKTRALVEQTNTRAMQIVSSKLPAKTEKKAVVAASDKKYRMSA